jgi:predicted glycoside hydrolase/deacetylase ChbG (UPF0249 family)
MSSCLILNADDFGLTRGINRAIEELFRAGAITSATMMATGPAFDDAVRIAHANPGLGIGCHIVLTDGIPVLHPAEIPTLLGPDGKSFRSSLLDFQLAAVTGALNEDEICREAQAQIAKLQRAGLDVTHIDTHKHTHIFPSVARPLLFVAERSRIGAIRNPFEQAWSRGLGHPGIIRRAEVALLAPLRRKFAALPQIRSGAVATTDGTIGMSATGRLDRGTLESILQRMPHGTWEMVLHPGYNDSDLDKVTTRLRSTREIEMQALLDVFGNQPDSSGNQKFTNGAHLPTPELIHYGALGPFARLRELRQFKPNTGHEVLL